MAHFDVFNGDADGLCALVQLHLHAPRDSHLITGVKRDIALLQRVDAGPGDTLTVLDISLDSNRGALLDLLARGCEVQYFDHHYPGDIPLHPRLAAHIDTAADRGTSLLVDSHLNGHARAWAVVGTFGDNFDATAGRAAAALDIRRDDLARLRELGILLNYNGYGENVADLHLAPDALFERLRPYADPLDFIGHDDGFALLREGYHEDMARAAAVRPELLTPEHAVIILPAMPWARRVSGVHANALASAAPERAHALLTERPDGDFVVSVRAPLVAPDGADALCRQFPTGGGRRAAAGINRLPADAFREFVDAFLGAFRAG